jgi:hypothetical protein
MRARIAGLALVVVGALSAHGHEAKKSIESRGENESVVITATVYANPEAVKDLLGSDLGGYYTVVALQVAPRFGKEVSISHDDFVLKTDRDGDKSTPMEPSQIAGRGALVLHDVGGMNIGGMMGNMGPIWSGYPGSTGPPRRVGGDGAAVGNGGAEGTQAKVHSGVTDKPNPLLKLLTAKELPEKKTGQPVSGLLYFAMEKQKIKDLELRYNMSDDKIVMRFRQER